MRPRSIALGRFCDIAIVYFWFLEVFYAKKIVTTVALI